MQKRRLFGKYFELRYIWCVLFCCAVLFLYVPLLGDTYGLTSTYCEVLLDGDVIGAVSDPSAVDQAFLNARAQIAREKNGLVLANVECDFRQVDKLVGSTLEPGELESVIHDLLQEKIKTARQKYYLVKVNEFTVNLATMDEVKEMLTASLAKYDPDGLFKVEVVSDNSRELNAFTVQVVPKGEIKEGDGLKALDFFEKVEIAEAYIDKEHYAKLDIQRCGVNRFCNMNRKYGLTPVFKALKPNLMLDTFDEADKINTKAKAKKIIHQVLRVTSALGISFLNTDGKQTVSTANISIKQLMKTINKIAEQEEKILEQWYCLILQENDIPLEYCPTPHILDAELLEFEMRKDLSELLFSKYNCSYSTAYELVGMDVRDEIEKRNFVCSSDFI